MAAAGAVTNEIQNVLMLGGGNSREGGAHNVLESMLVEPSKTLEEEDGRQLPFIPIMSSVVPQDPSHGGSGVGLALLLSLGIAFAVLMIVLLVVAGYMTFRQDSDDEREYDEETARLLPRNLLSKRASGLLLSSPYLAQMAATEEASDEVTESERNELARMSKFEVELYTRGKGFRMMNPPLVKPFGTYMNATDRQCIKDRGIQAYYLLPSINDNVDKRGNFLPSFIVNDKLNIQFTKHNRSSSTIMNYPFPYNRKDAVYFEVKVYRFKNLYMSNSIFSVGLVTCPYPYFLIPGVYPFSIAYESTGKLRINNAFYASTLLPKLQEGDVVGFGYRYRSGTIFITHNGKKLMDLTHNVGIDLFIGIGAMNAAYTRTYTREGLVEDIDNVDLRTQLAEAELEQKCQVTDILNEQLLQVHDPAETSIDSDEIELHVNIGNLGFVFVEANVKKYAFGSLYGDIGIPPAYNGDEIKGDIILQKGEDLPPHYPEDELDFFGDIRIDLGHPIPGTSNNSSQRYFVRPVAHSSTSTSGQHSHHNHRQLIHTESEALLPSTQSSAGPASTLPSSSSAHTKSKKR